jgi:hypothetical protein
LGKATFFEKRPRLTRRAVQNVYSGMPSKAPAGMDALFRIAYFQDSGANPPENTFLWCKPAWMPETSQPMEGYNGN